MPQVREGGGMTTPTIRRPGVVVLHSGDWVEEIRGELIRLGYDKGRADQAAKTMLRRILARSRWPAACYAVDDRVEADS